MTAVTRALTGNTTIFGTTANLNVSKPTGFVSGDYILIFLSIQNSAAGTFPTIPSGWSTVLGPTFYTTSNVMAIFGKFATGSEPATWNFVYSVTPAGPANAIVYAASGIHATTPIDVGPITTLASGGGSTVRQINSITTTTAGCIELAGGNLQSSTTGTIHTVSPWIESANTSQQSGGRGQVVSYKENVAQGATGTVELDISPALNGVSWHMALRPSAGGSVQNTSVDFGVTSAQTATGYLGKPISSSAPTTASPTASAVVVKSISAGLAVTGTTSATMGGNQTISTSATLGITSASPNSFYSARNTSSTLGVTSAPSATMGGGINISASLGVSSTSSNTSYFIRPISVISPILSQFSSTLTTQGSAPVVTEWNGLHQVMLDKPYQYYTFSGTNGNKDISGNANHITSGYTNTIRFPIVPGLYPGTLSNVQIPNVKNIMQPATRNQPFTIEFWVQPANNQLLNSSLNSSNIFTILSIVNTEISYYRDRFRFRVSGTSQHMAEVFAPYPDRRYHVALIYTGSSIHCVVNGEPSDEIVVSDSFQWLDAASSIVGNATTISNLAFFDRAIPVNRIKDRYESIIGIDGYKDICLIDGAEFFDCISSQSIIDSATINSNFIPDNSKNFIIDSRNRITLPQIKDINHVPGNPTYVNGILLSAGKYLWKDNVSTIFSTESGYIAGKFITTSAPTTRQYLLTITNPSIATTWSWYIYGSGVINLETVVTDTSGVQTITITPYQTAVPTGLQAFAWIFYAGTIKLYSGGAANALNTIGGISTVSIPISISNDSTMYVGTNYDQTYGPPPNVDNLAFSNSVPNSVIWSGAYADLSDPTYAALASCMYQFNSSLAAYQVGSMKVYPQLVSSQVDSGGAQIAIADTFFTTRSAQEQALMPVGTINRPSTTSRTAALYSGFQNTLINNGEVAGTHFSPGEISIALQLSTNDSDDWRPIFDGLDLKSYSTKKILSSNSHSYLIPVSQTSGHIFISDNDKPSTDPDPLSGILIPTSGGPGIMLENELADYSYSTIEFLYYAEYNGSIGSVEIMCLKNSSPHRAILRSNLGITQTGSGAFSAVYLNGTPLVAGTYTPPQYGSWNHIVAITSSKVSGNQLFLNSHGDGTSASSGNGYDGLAVYGSQLTATQVANHYAVAMGRDYSPIDGIETISIDQYVEPVLYSYNWLVTSAS